MTRLDAWPGRELGMHALDGYSEIKNVYLATG